MGGGEAAEPSRQFAVYPSCRTSPGSWTRRLSGAKEEEEEAALTLAREERKKKKKSPRDSSAVEQLPGAVIKKTILISRAGEGFSPGG